jgi:hypothetical protein
MSDGAGQEKLSVCRIPQTVPGGRRYVVIENFRKIRERALPFTEAKGIR